MRDKSTGTKREKKHKKEKKSSDSFDATIYARKKTFVFLVFD